MPCLQEIEKSAREAPRGLGSWPGSELQCVVSLPHKQPVRSFKIFSSISSQEKCWGDMFWAHPPTIEILIYPDDVEIFGVYEYIFIVGGLRNL